MNGDDTDDRLQKLVDRVYDAVIDNGLWSGLAPEIAHVFDSTSVVLKIHGGDGQVSLLETTDNLVVAPKDREWAEYWHRNDIWVERSELFGMSKIVTSQQLVPDAEYERTGFYQDWNRRLGIYHMVGAVFPVEAGMIGVLGIHRPRRASAYDESECHRVGQFLPHLYRALRLRNRLAKVFLEHEATLEALDKTGTGMVVVDAHARVLHANQQADWILRQTTGIKIAGGRLTSCDPATAARLTRLIKEAIQTATGEMTVPSGALSILRPERLPLTVSVSPLRLVPGASDIPQPAAIVMIRDPEGPAPSHAALRDMFGLTRTEAAVASALADGKSINGIAAAFGIGIGTVRSHIKKILVKTGTSRQAQLVALVLRSVAAHSDQ
jgi:DNA-binding CsgD family transcriptional regulator